MGPPTTTAKPNSGGEHRLVDVHVICAERLKWPAGPLRRPLQAYAVGWIDPAHKARTLPDRAGGENPAWNERLLFKVPSVALAADSTAALTVEIFAAAAGGSWQQLAAAISGDHLVGYARILLGPLRLPARTTMSPHVASAAVRRANSGSIHGSLNLAVSVIPPSKLPTIAVDALRRSAAVSFRELIDPPRALRPANRQLTASTPPLPPPSPSKVAVKKGAHKKEAAEEEEEEGDENVSGGGVVFCGPCIMPFPRKIHLSPSDQNLMQFMR